MGPHNTLNVDDLAGRIRAAVTEFWRTRDTQSRHQGLRGQTDQGARGAVTGGAQMDGFISLLTDVASDAGVPRDCIFHDSRLELPGYFRAEKKWDMLIVVDGQLLLALEAKSQVGSFGNNFNNRTEEAMGSAMDLWTAYREGAFNRTVKPWLGYLFVLEDSPKSQRPVSVKEPHFKVFPEFVDASYAKRYELFCRKLVRELHYNAAALLVSPSQAGRSGAYSEPADDLAVEMFVRSMVAHLSAFNTAGAA